ncbi:hypothetical protein CC78DRAFT_541507 [Lojkania enalia]|uniref:Rhodopsin domain-containing protein n=1 Tax=Lojkania enalia TaxID=147567 RepID=A0A9P4KE56_9PLEO|nr:hypothetical protein CC78DRAFT_541507 [Didymosphaeria enalia]
MAVLKRQGPPPGIPTDPNYFAFSIQKELSAITISLMTVALVAVIGRVYIRACVLHVFRLDDYFIVAAMACSVAACSIFLHVVTLGMGKHIFAIPPENIMPLLMWIFIVAVLIPLAVCFVKISIALFLLRLTQRTRYHKFLWGIVAFLVVFTLFTFFSLIFGCTPIAANWDFSMRPPPMGTGNAKCLSLTAYRNMALFNNITNILTDIVLALLPVPLIWTLQVNKRTKASLIFILGLGFFACAAAIIKTPLLWHFFDDMDSTGERSWYYAWQIIEMNVAILAATLPALKPAFRWLLETAKTLATGVSGNRTANSNGYKRQVSSGYLRQKEGVHYQCDSAAPSSPRSDRRSKGKEALEMEIMGLGPYNVTVAGDDKSVDGAGGASNASSDAILRAEERVPIDARRIVRTTKVTIVTS